MLTFLDQYQYLGTYPSLNPTVTLTCYQLTVVELGRRRWAVAQILILIHFNCVVLPKWLCKNTFSCADPVQYQIQYLTSKASGLKNRILV